MLLSHGCSQFSYTVLYCVVYSFVNSMICTGILQQAGSNLFLNGIVMGILFAGGQQIATNEMQAGDLMSFLVAAQTIQKSLAQLGIMFGTYVRGTSAGARVFEVRKAKRN